MSRAVFIQSVAELDGRDDPKISSYYVETAALNRIRRSPFGSIGMVGLKGSGKTTLFRLLTEDWAWEPKIIRVGLAPHSSEFEGYVDRVNCLQFAKSVRQGVAILLAELIDENIRRLPEPDKNSLSKWIERKAVIFKPGATAFDLIKKLRGLQILGCGLDIADPVGGDKQFKIRRISDSEYKEIWDLLESFAQYGIRIRIVIDDPDRLFTQQGKSDPQLLAGYILGTNDISKNLNYVQFVHILKSNVYQDIMNIEEMANLPTDYFDYITWSVNELKDMIEARLAHADLKADEIFQDSIDDAISLLSDQIRNGPRDILRYIEIILKESSTAKVSLNSIVSNQLKFKRAARRQMETIYASVYPGIDLFLNSMFWGRADLNFRQFREKFLALRLSSQPIGLDYAHDWLRSADRAFRALFEAGVVDVKTEEGWKRPYEAGYFLFDLNEDAEVPQTAVFLSA